MRSWTFGCTESSKARRVVIIVPRFLVGFGLSALCSLIVVGLSTGDPSLAGTITPKPPQWVDFNASNYVADQADRNGPQRSSLSTHGAIVLLTHSVASVQRLDPSFGGVRTLRVGYPSRPTGLSLIRINSQRIRPPHKGHSVK